MSMHGNHKLKSECVEYPGLMRESDRAGIIYYWESEEPIYQSAEDALARAKGGES